MKYLLILFMSIWAVINTASAQTIFGLDACQQATYYKLSDVESWLYSNDFVYSSSDGDPSEIQRFIFGKSYNQKDIQAVAIFRGMKGVAIIFTTPVEREKQLRILKSKGARELTKLEEGKLSKWSDARESIQFSNNGNREQGLNSWLVIDKGYYVFKSTFTEDGIANYAVFVLHPSEI